MFLAHDFYFFVDSIRSRGAGNGVAAFAGLLFIDSRENIGRVFGIVAPIIYIHLHLFRFVLPGGFFFTGADFFSWGCSMSARNW